MKTIPVLLVDDEPHAHQYLRKLLSKHPEFGVVADAYSVSEAIDLCEEHHPELVFLDIEMPRANGFKFFAGMKRPPRVIFVTGFEKFAARAFDVNALDYLMKPVSPERLATAVGKFLADYALRTADSNDPSPITFQPIFQKIDGQTVSIFPPNILSIQADGNYSTVRLLGGDSLFVYRSLNEWEELLTPSIFVRLDRSLIINIHQLSEFIPLDRNTATLVFKKGAETNLTIGRTAMANVRKALAARQSVPLE
jgi:two-component system, LytTR family, response regulator